METMCRAHEAFGGRLRKCCHTCPPGCFKQRRCVAVLRGVRGEFMGSSWAPTVSEIATQHRFEAVRRLRSEQMYPRLPTPSPRSTRISHSYFRPVRVFQSAVCKRRTQWGFALSRMAASAQRLVRLGIAQVAGRARSHTPVPQVPTSLASLLAGVCKARLVCGSGKSLGC